MRQALVSVYANVVARRLEGLGVGDCLVPKDIETSNLDNCSALS